MQILPLTNTPSEQPAAATAQIGSSLIPDWLGVAASVGCAIHCAAMPFLIAFLPMLGLSFLADGSFHKVMVAVCGLLALLAFVPGWRVHRKWQPAGIALAGLTLIGVAAFGLEGGCACCAMPETDGSTALAVQPDHAICADACCEHCAAETIADSEEQDETRVALAGFVPWITPLGGIILIAAHLVNRRFSCLCGCCPPKPSAG